LEFPKRILLTAIAVFIYGIILIPVSGQVASFTAPDTVCVNAPVNITNTSTGATSSSWNFCVANANTVPAQSSLGNPGNQLSRPGYMDYVLQNGNYHAFMVNNSPGGLIRLDFGNSLLNTPTAVNLGNFGGIIPDGAQGIQVVQNNGIWYAIITGGDPGAVPVTPSRILKVDFGTDLTNPAPAATNWGNIGAMNYPHDLYMFRDGSDWYGFTINFRNSTVTKFSFGPDFNTAPAGENLGNLGNLNGPTGICPINDNGIWRIFVTSSVDHTMSRIDFGNSLLNTPSGAANLGNPGNLLNNPRDIYIFNYCGRAVGFVANNSGGLTRLNFNTLNTPPAATASGNINGTANIHSISKVFRVQEELFAFLPGSVSNTLSRIRFPGCNNASVSGSSQATPPPVVYSTPGTYNISLTINDGLPTQSTFCKQVVVSTRPVITKSADATACEGDSVQLTASGGTGYQWTPWAGLSNPGIANPKAAPPQTTKYYVDVSNHGCIIRDSVTVSVINLPIFGLTPSHISICPGDTVQIVASGGDSYRWLVGNNPVTNGIQVTPTANSQYRVEIRSQTCNAIDTMSATVAVKPAPVVTVHKSADIDCRTNEVQLFAQGGIQYDWTPAAGLSSSTISNPFAKVSQNTTYTVAVTGLNGCVATGSITVVVQGPGSASNAYYLPNAFTPNQDGLNDCFGITQWGVVTSLQFYVYDRTGQTIFSAKDPSACWDGRFKGIAQPPGTYVYSIKATTNCGEVERTGTVVLVR
jgi:gliding motility-associated-like protein